MTDQTFETISASRAEAGRAFEARALAPTSAFWFAMFVASALGANIGDFWAEDLGLGLPTSFASLAVICGLMIWGDRENGRKTEVFYWLAIVCLRAVATNVGDFFTHALHMDYLLASIVIGAATLVLGYFTFPTAEGASPKIDLRYWAAMFAGGVFGTIGGDLVSHTIGLFFAALLLGALLLVVIRFRTLAAPTAMAGYWCIVLAERAAGTPMGDWLAKSRGLNLGLPISMVITATVLVVALSIRAARTTADPSARLSVAAHVALPTMRLALLVLSLVGCYWMMAIYVMEHPRDPSLVLAYGVGLAINALYLAGQELAAIGSSRLGRLITLWCTVKRQDFDRWVEAREADLRERTRSGSA